MSGIATVSGKQAGRLIINLNVFWDRFLAAQSFPAEPLDEEMQEHFFIDFASITDYLQRNDSHGNPLAWSLTMRSFSPVILSLFLSLGCTPGFTKIVDFDSSVPDSEATFTQFEWAAFDGTTAAFIASRSDAKTGVYRWTKNSPLTLVVETGQATLAVNGDTVNSLGTLTIDQGKIAVGAVLETGKESVLSDVSGSMVPVVVTASSTPPVGDSYFKLFDPWIDNGQIAFQAYCNPLNSVGNTIVLLDETNAASKVVSMDDELPGTMLNFYFAYGPQLYQDSIMFYGGNAFGSPLRRGLHLSIENDLSTVADTTTPIPGGNGNFIDFQQSGYCFDGAENQVLFIGHGANSYQGVFRAADGNLTKLIDTDTPLPEGGQFLRFIRVGATGNGTLVLAAVTADGNSVYTTFNGELQKVLAPGDKLDGNTVVNCSFDPPGVRDSQLVIVVQSIDSENQYQYALYLVDLEKIHGGVNLDFDSIAKSISRFTHEIRF